MSAEVRVASADLSLRIAVRRDVPGGVLLETPGAAFELSAQEARALSGALCTAAAFEPRRPLRRLPDADTYFRVSEDGVTA